MTSMEDGVRQAWSVVRLQWEAMELPEKAGENLDTIMELLDSRENDPFVLGLIIAGATLASVLTDLEATCKDMSKEQARDHLRQYMIAVHGVEF